MKVLKVKEYKDGSAKIDVEISQVEKDELKKIYDKKRFHPNLIKHAIAEGVKILAGKVDKKGGK